MKPAGRSKIVLLLLCALCAPLVRAQSKAAIDTAKKIDDQQLRRADERPGEWLTHGRNYAETRYSPLKQIDAGNVARLGLAWSFEAETNRGLEATPLVAGGVIYTTGSWSIVYAVDARTGKLIWKWDPEVPRQFGQKACCDVVNRGVALYKGKVYVGTIDGRLAALDAATGKPVWQVVTVDQSQPYTITGAPRVVKGNVLIGNAGGEFGVRGYVTAYNAETGKQAWRFYTVPGDPAKPFESPALARAGKTWNGEWWKLGGGGGTVWDSMAYDPELDLLYIGTGNGSPWSQAIRSPQGGDNLYLSSIVAVRPATGEYVWHYQTTPGDSWDYTATQHMILADLQINGRARKVLMQAPKNGFFYVLDRATGELISAEPFAEITWAKAVDKQTGRPIEIEAARYRTSFSLHKPGPLGAHNWQPMSFNLQTGLVYIPAQDVPGFYLTDAKFKYQPGGLWNLGLDTVALKEPPTEVPPGSLLAWDPVAQRERWRVPYKSMWNGGTLTTAGNLVFQGTADGRLVAYSADAGRQLWDFQTGIGVMGSPVTYELDGKQYVSVMVGWGGAFALVGGYSASSMYVQNTGRLLTFVLDGKQSLPDVPKRAMAALTPIASDASPELIAKGQGLFAQFCAVCHGVGAVGGGGVLPALPLSKPAVFEMYPDIILHGALSSRGMPAFKNWLTAADVTALRAYVVKRRGEMGK